MSGIEIIVIGRNEGERLRRCLESAVVDGERPIYVDSNSTDGSVELAKSFGAEVVELDLSLPFSAARARNAGFERIGPQTRLVQFVDGDCQIVTGWIDRARREFEARADVAVVCGRRRERFPEKSIYNRLADVEWDTPVGETQSCGGDAMMRADAFRAVGGFDASVVAGEEPELCQRLRNKGWKILRIEAEMTLHDSQMLLFSQWWRRSIRGGYGAMDVASRFGAQGLFVNQVRSARIWGIGWPLAVFGTGLLVGSLEGFYRGLVAFAVVSLALPAQMLRVAMGVRRRTIKNSDAVAYGVLTMLSKWANLLGQVRYWRDRRSGKTSRLIEYKNAPAQVARVSGN